MSLIFLTGMTGAGKTTVGKRLAELLHYNFIDTDAEIENRIGLSISEIFAYDGKEAFREDEADLISDICFRLDSVIALGAGTFEYEFMQDRVAESGTLVYLRLPLDLLVQRCETMTDRPLLAKAPTRDDLEDVLKDMLRIRESGYLRAAIVIDVRDGETAEAIADRIVARLKDRAER